MPTEPQSLIGRTLDGRYRIEQVAARGGMATVYVATDLRLQRPVAVKVMHAELATDPDFVKRFVRESRASAALAHPNVVAVHDQGQDAATAAVYLVMELVVGRTLRDVLNERGTLSVAQALAVLDPVLQALSTAHSAGFIHRDIKPENVLIGDNGQVKVADFGLARALTNRDSHASTRGVLIGTAAYLSPEQVENGDADARSDLYSAGVMLFEMVTGRLPHSGQTPIALAFAHVHNDVPPPSQLNPALPASIDLLVANSTARDPRLRYANAEDFLSDVRQVRLDAEGFRPAPIPQDQMTEVIEREKDKPEHITESLREPRGRSRRASRNFAAFAVVVAAIAGWWFAVGSRVTVPQLVGSPVATAEQDLKASGLSAKVVLEFSDAVADGLVIAAEPESGSSAAAGSVVLLRVSKGPELVVVPDVADVDQVTATQSLAGVGLQIENVTREYSATVARDQVILSEPAAGERVRPGSGVVLVLSKGPRPVKLPDVVGKSRQSALALLKASGFKQVEKQHAYSESVPEGNIIEQSPGAGEKKQPDTLVTIVISDGPPPVTVPSVLGMNWQLASKTLKTAGLDVDITWQNKCKPPKQVVNTFVMSQNPEGNQTAPKGSTVALEVAKACGS